MQSERADCVERAASGERSLGRAPARARLCFLWCVSCVIVCRERRRSRAVGRRALPGTGEGRALPTRIALGPSGGGYGVSKWFDVGASANVVVANLAPRKMMGLESRGMVLAAGDGETLSVLSVDKELPPGSIVK